MSESDRSHGPGSRAVRPAIGKPVTRSGEFIDVDWTTVEVQPPDDSAHGVDTSEGSVAGKARRADMSAAMRSDLNHRRLSVTLQVESGFPLIGAVAEQASTLIRVTWFFGAQRGGSRRNDGRQAAAVVADRPFSIMGNRIAVFGTGYLGATHAACMATLGHTVLGVDVDAGKLDKLNSGEAPFFEPGLDEILRAAVGSGNLRFTASYGEAAEFAEAHFIAVATPQKQGEFAADLTYVESVIDELAPLLRQPAVIFGKSTVPVGTASRLGEIAQRLAPAGDAVEVAWNPEFLREGFAVQDTLHPDRIVLGLDADNPGRAEEVARSVYQDMIDEGVPFLVTDRETAELAKTAANAFLATKISFINAMSEICEASGANIVSLADAIGHDDRIGRKFLNAGIGFGGGCLPKDIRALMARSGELGANQALTLLREVDSINMRRRSKTVELATELVGGSLIGTNVAVLGAAFKPNSDDIRDSPALNIAGQMQLQGASVSVYDPKAIENARKQFPTLHYASSVSDACFGADIVLVLTEWEDFRRIDPQDLNSVVRQRRVLDGRNCLDRVKWKNAGWAYRAVGRR